MQFDPQKVFIPRCWIAAEQFIQCNRLLIRNGAVANRGHCFVKSGRWEAKVHGVSPSGVAALWMQV